ncbi:MAG: DUF3990 domain-containing protein, partial [candidate division Zixibacteria bacterium]|nr:DUF3990 domain-containing protein [Gammaproteobacteria bacterium]NIX55712.1 DUF3990 domain-containing protein [candidate division Zixibacteria bacterium]
EPYGYTGEWWEDEVGLLYLRARWYRPETGSFLSRDPFAGIPEQPYSLHPYQYGYSNPIRYVDPMGLCVRADNRAAGCPDWMADWVFEGIDAFFNATATPAFAPGLPDQAGNIDDLQQQAERAGTGAALPWMGAAVDFTPGYGDVKGFVEVFTGEDLATGEALGTLRYLGLLGVSELRHLRSLEKVTGICEPVRVLYHGTDNISAEYIRQGIDLARGRLNLDFNPTGQGGFYVTKYLDQAQEWAIRRARADYAPGDIPIVLKFTIPESEFQQLNSKLFQEANEEWAEFVIAGRRGTLRHVYDYVEGPMLRNPIRSVIWGNMPPRPTGHQLGLFTEEAAARFQRYLQP